MRLIVCHPDSVSRAARFAGEWVFADSDFLEYERISARLNPEAVIPLCPPQDFQRRVVESRGDLSDWMDSNLKGLPPVAALLSSITRNPFFEFFPHVIWARVISQKLERGGADLLVVTRSLGLARVLHRHAAACGVPFDWLGRRDFAIAAMRHRARALATVGYDIFHALCRVVASRLILGRRHLARVRDVKVLVDTFVFDGDVTPSGSVTHRYFPGLMGWYASHRCPVAYYPALYRVPIQKLPSLYRGYRSSSCLFAPPERFYTVADVLWAGILCATYALRKHELKNPSLWDVDLSELVKAGSLAMVAEAVQPLLMIQAPRRMAAAGLRPTRLLDWFENQMIDQATMVGFRDGQPGCEVVAVRPYPLYSRNLLSYQVTTEEVQSRRVPREHWVIGSMWLRAASTYDAEGRYALMPSLRNSEILSSVPSPREGTDLLVMLTYSMKDSAQMLAAVDSALGDLSACFSAIRIKAHPALGADKLKSIIGTLHPAVWSTDGISWEKDDVKSLLGSARVVITAGSSAALEAVVRGIPVILLGARVGIDLNPSEFIDSRMCKVVFDDRQLRCAVRDWSPVHPVPHEERLAIGKRLKDDCFEPVTEETMECFRVA